MNSLEATLHHLASHLDLATQRRLTDRCREIGAAPAGFYRPIVRGGGKMRVDMVCLGLHWNALTYRYEPRRSDFDGRPVQPLPEDLAEIAWRAAAVAGMSIRPDICILNGVTRIIPDTGPPELALDGRLSLTFRQY